MHVLREPNSYPIVLIVPHDGAPPTRVDTGLMATWFKGELIVMVSPDELDGLIETLTAAVSTARTEDD